MATDDIAASVADVGAIMRKNWLEQQKKKKKAAPPPETTLLRRLENMPAQQLRNETPDERRHDRKARVRTVYDKTKG